jgi:hypothetical protein
MNNIAQQIPGNSTMAQTGGLPLAVLSQTDQPNQSSQAYLNDVPGGTPVIEVVFLTSSGLEGKIVQSYLKKTKEITHPQGTVYNHGVFESCHCTWQIAIMEANPDNGMYVEPERAVAFLSPELILFIGNAYGINRIKAGDVVMPCEIFHHSGSIADTNIQGHLPDYGLEQRARAEAKRNDWHLRAYESYVDGLEAHIVPLIAQSNFNCMRKGLFGELRGNASDAVSGIGGFDFLKSTQRLKNVAAAAIYGVCNTLRSQGPDDSTEKKELAAKHAVAFAFELVVKLRERSTNEAGKKRAGLVQVNDDS